jgi:hypothetical protein
VWRILITIGSQRQIGIIQGRQQTGGGEPEQEMEVQGCRGLKSIYMMITRKAFQHCVE